MPQLDPSPWFALLSLLLTCLYNNCYPLNPKPHFPKWPAPQSTQTDKTNHWTWSW
uniref:ATP synthase complex subunit 8 n=1 Tax=Scartelaos gigas TaxID=508010 RepID=A0A0U2NEF8_9GOBI|nr:ATP synthase F0 subunit 8 [Scartelaos gigas]ALJ01799.1 ATP synthase F0 subunit 8 [Scartelaos gigas]